MALEQTGLTEQMIAARMMRGALRGAAEPEKAPPKYCQGKLDNDRPCRVVVLHGDYCIRHQKEIDAVVAGAPLPPGRIERPQERDMERHRCGKEGCGRSVKKDGDMCWQHKGLEIQVEAGLVASTSVEGQTALPIDDGRCAVSGCEGGGVEQATGLVADDRPAADPAAKETFAPEADAPGAEIPAAPTAKSLLALVASITEPSPPPPGIFLDFSSHEDLLSKLRELSDNLNHDIIALLAGLVRGELYAPKHAAVRGE